MSRPSRMRYSCLLQSHVVSLLLSLVSTLFSDWRLTFFDIQVPSVSNKELVLPLHAHCGLSRLLCNGHSLLSNSYLSRTGIIEDPSCSVCDHPSQDTSHPILHCLFAPHALCLSTTSGSGPGEIPGLWGSMVSHHAPYLGRDGIKTSF